MNELNKNIDFLENEDFEEVENFTYTEIAECIQEITTPEVEEILKKAGLTSKKILSEVREEAILPLDGESLEEYSRRTLNFLLINKINKSLGKKFSANENIQELSQNPSDLAAEFEDKYTDAYNDGDTKKMIDLINEYLMMPIIIEDEIFSFEMTPEQQAEFQKVTRAYLKKLNVELNKKNREEEKLQEPKQADIEIEEAPEESKEMTSEDILQESSQVDISEPEGNQAFQEIDFIQEIEYQNFEEESITTSKQSDNEIESKFNKKYMDQTDFESVEQAFRWSFNPNSEAEIYNKSQEDDVINRLTFNLGMNIEDGLADLVNFKRAGHNVITVLNGITIDTRECETPEEIIELYRQKEQESIGRAEEDEKVLTPDDFNMGVIEGAATFTRQAENEDKDFSDVRAVLRNLADEELRDNSEIQRIGNIANHMVEERKKELGIDEKGTQELEEKDDIDGQLY